MDKNNEQMVCLKFCIANEISYFESQNAYGESNFSKTRAHEWYILDNQDLVKDRNVLDIGCGCGAGSIAAAKMKAKYVLANDIDHHALAATHLNANLNGVLIDTSSKNLIGTKCEEFNVILIGDMFYDEDFSQTLFKWLIKLHEAGKTILIGDPGRHGLTEKRRRHVQMLAEYKMPRESQEENNGFTKTKVWKLNKLI
ncbi:electron transfer flavoprotein beta subunit lysine methyltransferase isoform X3 [Bombyx mori]|uniref:electron transfer flavoprotein beta subunit lysine methyltransferase isoform X3 n=1 Tax=Bombyx mori TaxID=7091 RepID=UPI002ED35F3A